MLQEKTRAAAAPRKPKKGAVSSPLKVEDIVGFVLVRRGSGEQKRSSSSTESFLPSLIICSPCPSRSPREKYRRPGGKIAPFTVRASHPIGSEQLYQSGPGQTMNRPTWRAAIKIPKCLRTRFDE